MITGGYWHVCANEERRANGRVFGHATARGRAHRSRPWVEAVVVVEKGLSTFVSSPAG